MTAPVEPIPIDPGPAVPTSADPEATFDAMFEASLAWQKDELQPGANALAAATYTNALAAAEAAALAVPAAAAAEAASNAALWVSGTNYAAGYVVWSPINALSYRRKTAGAGTTDPSADSANWASLAGGVPSLLRSARTSNTMLAAADKGKLIDITSGTFSQTFDAVATLGDGWWCYLRNSGTGVVTLDPTGAETIDGASTKILGAGQTVIVQCDGAGLRTVAVSGVGNHEVVVHTGNGHGSTNTKIRRFTTALTSVGTAITYADSATLGASFTVNEAGLYAIHYSDMCTIGGASYGATVNSAELTTSIASVAISSRLMLMTTDGASAFGVVSRTVRLLQGDVIRAHTQGETSATTNQVFFSIRKVGV